MSKGVLGTFNGTVTPGVNMVEVFKANEIEKHENSHLKYADHMTLRKFGIRCPEGTVVTVNDSEIPVVDGHFELAIDMVDITKLVFRDAVDVNILYIY